MKDLILETNEIVSDILEGPTGFEMWSEKRRIWYLSRHPNSRDMHMTTTGKVHEVEKPRKRRIKKRNPYRA